MRSVVAGLCSLLMFGACNHPLPRNGPHGDAGAGSGRATIGASAGQGGVNQGGAGQSVPANLDPGWSPLRPLTNLEYDNTIRDLLGVQSAARATFQFDGSASRFAVIGAAAIAINDARYEQYANSASTSAAAAFADPVLRARIVTCQPAAADDTTCTRKIVTTFGLRAWRRPLVTEEADALVALAGASLADGASFEGAIQQVVTALLSSAPFLLRLEFDPNPASLAAHTLTPFELASRLSYFLWSSMPDDRLLTLAGNATLGADAMIRAEVDRMLDDPRSEGFLDGFAGPAFGGDDFASHQVDPISAPAWDDPLRTAMGRELRMYVGEFLRGDLSFATFLDADFNFVNQRLARHYGMDTTGLGEQLTRVVNTQDHRAGFLGLGATLTVSAGSTRSSPTSRGRWILDRLLCTTVPFGPVGTPDNIAEQITDMNRAVFAASKTQASCVACHKEMDGIGTALEQFDQTGAFRAAYTDGTPVDAKGALPDGTPVADERALAVGLAADPRLLPCVSRTALSYPLNRDLTAADAPFATQIVDRWNAGTPTLRALLEQIALNDTFRFRRGEGAP